MGDIADMMIEDLILGAYDWEIQYAEYNEYVENEYAVKGSRVKWFTEDGREIAVCEMQDTHLHNALSWIRNRDPNSPWISIFEREIEKRELHEGL